MGILDEDVARVRDQTDLVSLIGEKVALRRVGQRYLGLCPFHQEKTPSFNVNPTMGFWHCFGCNKSGDAITWERDIDGLDFVEAVEDLARRAGITLRYDDKAQAKDRSKRARLVEAVGAAIDYYHRRLLEAEDGGIARQYLRSRGFDGDAARRFSLGWSPNDWDILAKYLQQEKKLSREDIVTAGLAFVNKANKLQDQFRGRLLFPIYDAKGEPVGFGGRTLSDEGPKYKNSPETPIYRKSHLLYGLNWAKSEVVAKGDVVICEGYTDVMAFALAGAGNAVATCGTALADDHVRALKNLTRKVTLAYDADSAGQGAAEQWYRWESEYDIQVRVVDLPDGKDPADAWQADPVRLMASLDAAVPFLQFRVDRALAAADLVSMEGRGRAAELVASIVAEHPSELVRDQYVMQLSDRLSISADRLREAVARGPRPSTEPQRARTTRPEDGEEEPPEPERPVARRELDALRWAIHEPEMVSEWLVEELFLDSIAREAFTLLVECHDFHQAREAAQGQVRSLLERLAVEEPIPEDEPLVVQTRLMTNMVIPVAKRFAAELMTHDDPQRSMDLNRMLDDVENAEGVADWPRAQEAATHLVGWIVHEKRSESSESMTSVGPGLERVEQEA